MCCIIEMFTADITRLRDAAMSIGGANRWATLSSGVGEDRVGRAPETGNVGTQKHSNFCHAQRTGNRFNSCYRPNPIFVSTCIALLVSLKHAFE